MAVAGFCVFYEATIFDSRFSTRQVQNAATEQPVAVETPALQPQPAVPEPVPPAALPALRFSASAYCKGDVTASGVVPRSGVAAGDPDLLPVGSVIQVSALGPRYDGVYTIMDTGPKVQGHKIDIYLWSCTEALKFGRRAATVVVLRLGWNPRDTAPTLFERLLDWGERAADGATGARKR